MPDLITIDDIQDALGREPEDEEEEAQWAFYITLVSDFINEHVDVSFFPVEDETIRVKASYSGLIKLRGPVTSITNVANFRTGITCYYADWDGLEEIFGLYPEEVVDITYSYGYEEVPADIVNLVVSTILKIMGLNDTPGDLRSHQVGDVRDEYRDNGMNQLMGTYGVSIVNKYTDETFTIDTGGSGRYPSYMTNQIPTP